MSEPDKPREPYNVGYGKPPKDKQFRKGKSGNPTGRPKGSRGVLSIINEVAQKRVTIADGNGSKVVSLLEATAHQLAIGAAKGDHRCRREFLALVQAYETVVAAEERHEVPTERDRDVFKAALARMVKTDDMITPKVEKNEAESNAKPKDQPLAEVKAESEPKPSFFFNKRKEKTNE